MPLQLVFMREQPLAQDGVDAPIAVDHLGDAEIHRDGDQRDRLVLAQSLGGRQERPHLAERILEGEIDRGFLVEWLLRAGWELLNHKTAIYAVTDRWKFL